MREELILDNGTMVGFDGQVQCTDTACTMLELTIDTVNVVHRGRLSISTVDPGVVHSYTQHYLRTGGVMYRHVLGPFGYTIFKMKSPSDRSIL